MIIFNNSNIKTERIGKRTEKKTKKRLAAYRKSILKMTKKGLI